MGQVFGDENGILWTRQVHVGRVMSGEEKMLTRQEPPVPSDYKRPEYRSMLGCDRVALDIETEDKDLLEKGPGTFRGAVILGVGIGYPDGDYRYYPVGHAKGSEFNYDPEEFFSMLREDAFRFEGTVVGANLFYDLDFLAREGVVFEKANFYDVQIAEPLLDENKPSYKLDLLAKQYLNEGKRVSFLEEHYGPDFIKILKNVHPAHVDEYATGDLDLPLRIMDAQIPLLERDKLRPLLEIEEALTPLLVRMRQQGVRVDVARAERAYDECQRKEKEALERLKSLTGKTVDVWAADSLERAFRSAGVEMERTATGKPSFRKEWLRAHPSDLAKLVVEARKYNKIAGTFIKGYILDGNVNGRIHCMFHPLKSDDSGTVSGRFSSSGPNLQNIPANDPELGPLMRSMFLPEEGMLWGSVDWSQIEYRFLIHYAMAAKIEGVEKAAHMYQEDKATDFHAMASAITGVPRKRAKSINFGVVYGMGVATMAHNLGVTMQEAEQVLHEFHSSLPFLKGIYDLAGNRAATQGFITTILGRRRRFDMWEKTFWEDGKKKQIILSEKQLETQYPKPSDRRGFRRAFTHKALNALLQGSAADLMKKSMVLMWRKGLFDRGMLIPHLTVHDEMNVSVPDTKLGRESFAELIHTMENTIKLHVPILADGKLGANWSEAKG